MKKFFCFSFILINVLFSYAQQGDFDTVTNDSSSVSDIPPTTFGQPSQNFNSVNNNTSSSVFDWSVLTGTNNSNSTRPVSQSVNNNSSNQNTVTIPVTQNSTNNISTNVTTITTQNMSINQIQIPQNVAGEIDNLRIKYNFNQAQVSSLNQIARSYQYIINTQVRDKAEAFNINLRDVAATNCASSRILGQGLDESVNRIELASLNTVQKKAAYDYYSNFLDEGTLNTPQVLAACEDEFSVGNTQNINQSSNFQVNLNGVIPDQNITSKCLILTHFMEFGSRDSQVFPLQNFLMENGYLEMYPTGFFGRNTEFAVKEWQKRHNIDIKGWVGPSTRGSIAGLTCKNQASYDKAFKGEIIKKYVAPVKKVLAKTPLSQPTKTVIIATTTTSAIEEFKPSTFVNPVTTNNLSSLGATFFTKRSPVNTLYFTYKANTALDDIYTCISKNGNNKCESSSNFTKVKQKYEPGNIDMINNTTKWIFNVYYNIDTWGTDGGNIYIRNGLGNISEVYSVKVSNTL